MLFLQPAVFRMPFNTIIFKEICPSLYITGLFDPTIDITGGDRSIMKEDGLREMLEDYNSTYEQHLILEDMQDSRKMPDLRINIHTYGYQRINSLIS